eukprot:symbB.v1.2.029490.t1/scaffold3227.1/size60689/2
MKNADPANNTDGDAFTVLATSLFTLGQAAFLARSYQFLNPSAGNSGPAARFCVKNSRSPVLEEKALIEVFSQFRTVQPSFD